MSIIIIFLSSFAFAAQWEKIDKDVYIDKQSIKKSGQRSYDAITKITGAVGFSTIQIRANCDKKKMYYGEIVIYSPQGDYVMSDGKDGVYTNPYTPKSYNDRIIYDRLCK